MSIGLLCSIYNFLIGSKRLGILDVVLDGTGEKVCLLNNYTDL